MRKNLQGLSAWSNRKGRGLRLESGGRVEGLAPRRQCEDGVAEG
jgi:hypothetical protein